jgi:Tol biopolymer transport system component
MKSTVLVFLFLIACNWVFCQTVQHFKNTSLLTEGGDLKQLTDIKQISSSPAFSPDGQYISFRVTNEAYWRDAKKRDKTYQEKASDKRPAWIMKADGSDAHLVE